MLYAPSEQKKFYKVYRRITEVVVIEAENKEEAEQKVDEGDFWYCQEIKSEFSEVEEM